MKDFEKLYLGEKVIGVSAVLLFIFMYLNWFGVEISGPSGSVSLGSENAWQALGLTPVLLLATVVLSLLSVALRVSNFDYELPIAANAALAVLGVISAALILFRIADPPSFGQVNGLPLDATLEFGIFLALIAAAGIALGGYMAVREERGASPKAPEGQPSAH